MDKNTWTLKPDLPDTRGVSRNVEAMQMEYLIDHIGLTLWGALQEATDEHERTQP